TYPADGPATVSKELNLARLGTGFRQHRNTLARHPGGHRPGSPPGWSARCLLRAAHGKKKGVFRDESGGII
ncbi:MAG: hypothetical protein ACRDQ5_04475, partial [Sciscionella sp.]